MSQYQKSSFSGSYSGYIKFYEKEKAFASLFYESKYKKDKLDYQLKEKESQREYLLQKYAEEHKLKVDLKKLEDEFKQYAMEHEAEMERIDS